MTLPTHRVSYQVEYGILDQALSGEIGARVKLPSYDAASHLRARIHQARKIDRDENKEAYDEGHHMHGQSIYDKLVCKIKSLEGAVYLYLEQRGSEHFEVEVLGDPVEPEVEPEVEPPPLQVQEVIVTESLKRLW